MRRLGVRYFGTTDGFPPGDPGGGMTGMRPAAPVDGPTVIPGSTLGGVTVPFCLDKLSLRFPALPDGAIRSGGGDGEFCGAIGTVGFSGDAGCGFCACAEAAAKITAEHKIIRFMVQPSRAFRALDALVKVKRTKRRGVPHLAVTPRSAVTGFVRAATMRRGGARGAQAGFAARPNAVKTIDGSIRLP